MDTAKLERLMSLLGELFEQEWIDGATRDEISHVRFVVDERIEEVG